MGGVDDDEIVMGVACGRVCAARGMATRRWTAVHRLACRVRIAHSGHARREIGIGESGVWRWIEYNTRQSRGFDRVLAQARATSTTAPNRHALRVATTTCNATRRFHPILARLDDKTRINIRRRRRNRRVFCHDAIRSHKKPSANAARANGNFQ